MSDAIDFHDSAGEGTFLAPDGVSLFCRWRVASRSKAKVIIVHGAAEHSGRYTFLWRFLLEHGYSVFAADQRGMGRSSGLPGDVENFSDYVEDLGRFVSLIEGARGEEATFILGHSMGTIVAVRYALRLRVALRGLVLMSMPIAITSRPGPLLERLGRLAGTFLPRLRVPVGFRSEQLSSDAAVARAAEDDPLVDRFATLRWGVQMLDASDKLMTQVRRVALPVLVMQGEQDTIADSSAIRNLETKLADPNSRVEFFPDLRHELHNEVEPGREEVFRILHEWLEKVRETTPI